MLFDLLIKRFIGLDDRKPFIIKSEFPNVVVMLSMLDFKVTTNPNWTQTPDATESLGKI